MSGESVLCPPESTPDKLSHSCKKRPTLVFDCLQVSRRRCEPVLSSHPSSRAVEPDASWPRPLSVRGQLPSTGPAPTRRARSRPWQLFAQRGVWELCSSGSWTQKHQETLRCLSEGSARPCTRDLGANRVAASGRLVSTVWFCSVVKTLGHSQSVGEGEDGQCVRAGMLTLWGGGSLKRGGDHSPNKRGRTHAHTRVHTATHKCTRVHINAHTTAHA